MARGESAFGQKGGGVCRTAIGLRLRFCRAGGQLTCSARTESSLAFASFCCRPMAASWADAADSPWIRAGRAKGGEGDGREGDERGGLRRCGTEWRAGLSMRRGAGAQSNARTGARITCCFSRARASVEALRSACIAHDDA